MGSMLTSVCSVIVSFLLLASLFVFVFRAPLLVLTLVVFIVVGAAGGAYCEFRKARHSSQVQPKRRRGDG